MPRRNRGNRFAVFAATLVQLREDDVSPLPVAVSIYRAGEVYGITTCKDGGSNLPVMASPWQRQTDPSPVTKKFMS